MNEGEVGRPTPVHRRHVVVATPGRRRRGGAKAADRREVGRQQPDLPVRDEGRRGVEADREVVDGATTAQRLRRRQQKEEDAVGQLLIPRLLHSQWRLLLLLLLTSRRNDWNASGKGSDAAKASLRCVKRHLAVSYLR